MPQIAVQVHFFQKIGDFPLIFVVFDEISEAIL